MACARADIEEGFTIERNFETELEFDVLFFFSSRRRHTRCSRDWSSDVCSSDLSCPAPAPRPGGTGWLHSPHGAAPAGAARATAVHPAPAWPPPPRCRRPAHPAEIGRASCRERV